MKSDGIETAGGHDGAAGLTSRNLADATDPFPLFEEWLAEATASEPNDPNAMTLATVDETGMPDVRMVLLKDFGPAGFVFYTNLDSRKDSKGSARLPLEIAPPAGADPRQRLGSHR
jgi:pyridoxine/pyridoxamine 5'-phosphate oxidase